MSANASGSSAEGTVSADPSRAAGRDDALAKAIPPDTERRYTRDGDRLLFPDGAVAIEDRGARLVARTGNPQVARDLVAIAQARGWTRISSAGTESFRTEVSRAAARRSIEVTNDPRSARAAPPEAVQARPPSAEASEPASRPRRAGRRVGDLMTGEFVEAGKAPYRFEPGNATSFYVRVATAKGTRDLWGTHLREALTDSWTFPQPGDRIGVQYLGTQALAGAKDIPGAEPRRMNLWRIEKMSFFEERRRDAAAVRSGGPDLSQPDSMSPNARDAAAILRAANLFAASRLPRETDRERFIEAVRGTLASTLEKGDRLPEVKLRERSRGEDRTRLPDATRTDALRTR